MRHREGRKDHPHGAPRTQANFGCSPECVRLCDSNGPTCAKVLPQPSWLQAYACLWQHTGQSRRLENFPQAHPPVPLIFRRTARSTSAPHALPPAARSTSDRTRSHYTNARSTSASTDEGDGDPSGREMEMQGEYGDDSGEVGGDDVGEVDGDGAGCVGNSSWRNSAPDQVPDVEDGSGGVGGGDGSGGVGRGGSGVSSGDIDGGVCSRSNWNLPS